MNVNLEEQTRGAKSDCHPRQVGLLSQQTESKIVQEIVHHLHIVSVIYWEEVTRGIEADRHPHQLGLLLHQTETELVPVTVHHLYIVGLISWEELTKRRQSKSPSTPAMAFVIPDRISAGDHTPTPPRALSEIV